MGWKRVRIRQSWMGYNCACSLAATLRVFSDTGNSTIAFVGRDDKGITETEDVSET